MKTFTEEAKKLIDTYFPYGKCGTIPAEKEYFGFFIKECGVYLLSSTKNNGLPDEIVYVGISWQIGLRLAQHLPTFKERGVAKIKIIRIPENTNSFQIIKLEAILINKFNPKYNKSNQYLREPTSIPSVVNLNDLIIEINAKRYENRSVLGRNAPLLPCTRQDEYHAMPEEVNSVYTAGGGKNGICCNLPELQKRV